MLTYLLKTRQLLRHWHSCTQLLPYTCPVCNAISSERICTSCTQSLPTIKAQCQQCGLPLYPNESDTGKLYCGRCLSKRPYFDRCISPFHYKPPINQLITDLKFHQKLYYANLLGHLLLEKIKQQNTPLPECIIPVPLHSKRLRQRGFNQALEIARPIARILSLPLEPFYCQRIIATSPQMQQNRQARQNNIKNAFKINQPVSYQHIAIVDDVMTTGSTVNELARKFRQCGVEQIQIWSVARS